MDSRTVVSRSTSALIALLFSLLVPLALLHVNSDVLLILLVLGVAVFLSRLMSFCCSFIRLILQKISFFSSVVQQPVDCEK